MRKFCLAAALPFILAAAPAEAKDGAPPPVPAVFRQLVDCRALTDSAARLACYDRQVAALDAATQSREVVIADREEVQQARRGLFGFAAPVGRLLGLGEDGGANPDAIDKLVTKVARVGHTRDGGWRLGFDEGGTWEQIDTRGWVMSPRVGQAVEITKGALGSYFVSVDGQRGIKMRRVE